MICGEQSVSVIWRFWTNLASESAGEWTEKTEKMAALDQGVSRGRLAMQGLA